MSNSIDSPRCVVCGGQTSIGKVAGSNPAGVVFWLFTLEMAEIGENIESCTWGATLYLFSRL